MSHSLLYVLLLIMSCTNISLLVDNTLRTLSPEAKPTEVPSESVPQMTHSMMEGNRKGWGGWNDNNVNEREKGSDGSTLQRHHAFLGSLSARGSEGLAFP